jgi:conjugative relaxase-like TrwC/TraI family protein
MLSLGRLSPGQQEYYLRTVADGAEEYYTGAKEAPGEWVGQSAARLGLTGEVDADTLHWVLESRDPRTGERLTRAQGAPTVPGWDATFCAPKSVSLLFALGEPEASNEVRNAHDAVVAAALEVLEAEAARCRRGRGGTQRYDAEGFVAAAFRHRTSRAGDPHLHTHVLAANLVFAPHDGRWSALDARGLYGWAKTVGYLFEAQLRAELTRRLGVEWSAVTNGIAEIDGIPKEVLRAFSQRRKEIEMHMVERGETGARAAQIATYATRKAKDVEVAAESLFPEWRARAEEIGLDAGCLSDVLGRHNPVRAARPRLPDAATLFSRLASPRGLTEKSASFGRREVLQAICQAMPQGADIGEVIGLADAFFASRHAVPLGRQSGLRSSDVIRRGDGAVVATRVDEQRWTTPEMLATERRLIDAALDRREDGVGVTSREAVTTAIKARPSLSEEQIRMVRTVTGSGAGVEVVEGVAGSGKTHALGAARHAWQTSGYEVIGCALAARAAAELEQGSAIPSTTLDRLLRRLDTRDAAGLDAHTVVVVDEAAMVGTRKLARLLDHAERAGAKVVLVGDHYQLPEIDAGGAFAGLAERMHATQLVENRRQVHAWERAALTELRTGNPHVAFDAYQAHGRIHHAAHSNQLRERLVADWWASRAQGKRAVMVGTRNTDVEDLNRRARQHLAAAGQLATHEIVLGGRAFAVGDEVLATRNDYRLAVLNGNRLTVTRIDHHTATIHARRSNPGYEIAFPRTYTEAGHLTHAYALTFHKAQGMTAAETFVLADDTFDRHRAYTGLSRGTHHNALYLAEGDDRRSEERHAPEEVDSDVRDARERLGRMLAKSMATDHLEPGRQPRRAATREPLTRPPPAPDLGVDLGP